MTYSPEHQVINLIGNTTKPTEKKAILKKYKKASKLKFILFYTYNPYLKYHIRAIPDEVSGKGHANIGHSTWVMLDQLATRKITGNKAREELFWHIGMLTPTEGELLKLIVKKDLRVGIAAKTINSVHEGLISESYLSKAEDWDASRYIPGSYVGIKKDGVRAEYLNKNFYSFEGRLITGMDHLVKGIDQFYGDVHWDGELHIPGMDNFDQASGIIRSNAPEKLNVALAVIDDLGIRPMSQQYRLNHLENLFKKVDLPSSKLFYLKHYPTKTPEDVLRFFNWCLNNGEEGCVTKAPDSSYAGRRSYDWMKLKKNYEGEYLVEDVYEGKNKYVGMLGGIIITEDSGQKVKVGGGMSDQQREEWWNDPLKIVGKYITVAAMEKTKLGSLRHPVYKATRPEGW